MITSDQQNSLIIQSIIKASGPLDKPSFTKFIDRLKEIDSSLLPMIEDNLDEITDEFYSARVNLAIEIGVSKPAERKIVIETIAEIFHTNPNLKQMQLLTVINQELIKNNISYKVPISLSNNLESISKKSLGIIQGIQSLTILGKILIIEEIEAYIGKYLDKSSESLKTIVTKFGDALEKMSSQSSNPETMQKTAVDLLLSVGYLKIGIEEKDPGQLANILFYEMVAAQGCLNAQQLNNSKQITKEEATDQVAIILVKALR